MSEKASVFDCITSFVDGRVRLRHPALKDSSTAELVRSAVRDVGGITSAEVNPLTGSLLIYYTPEKLSREQLLELAELAATLLPIEEETLDGEPSDKVQERGKSEASVPAGLEKSLAEAKNVLGALSSSDDILKRLTSRGLTSFVNRGMLAALGLSLAALPLRNTFLHVAAGGVFVGGVLQHLLAHRKSL